MAEDPSAGLPKQTEGLPVKHAQVRFTVALPDDYAADKGLIGPVVVVFPDGLTNSFWADAKDSGKRVETGILQELMPHIESA